MDELDKLLSHSFEDIKRDGELVIKLLQLSQNFLNLSPTDCEKQHRSYYEKLKMMKNKPMKQEDYLDKKYILKPGKALYYNHAHYNNDTLTDRMAAAAIKKFPALVGAFLNEKERAILEAKAAGAHNIAEAKNDLTDEQLEDQIIALIEAEKFDEARELTAKLLVEKNRKAALKVIDKAEEAKAKKLADEEAKAKKLADEEAEAKKLADEKAEAKKLADEKAEAKKEKTAKEEFGT